MIRLLASTALGLVLASAAFAQSPGTNTKSEQTPQSQSSSAAPSTTSPSGAASTQQSQPQQSPTSAQNTQTTTPSSGANAGSGTSNAANSTDTSSRPQSGTANSSTTGNQPATQQSANSPATNQAQDRSNPPPNNSNQAQQAPSATGANQAQQAPNAPATNQAQGERTGTGSQAAAQGDVNLNRQQETRISASISHLNVRPLTNVNFSLNVGTVVPRDIQLSTLPPDVVEIVPQYRGYSFALVKDQIVVVDPATYKIVTVLPYSGQSTATTTTRERSASKFSDRDREVIRKHARSRTEGRSEARTTGSTARTEIHVGDRVPDTVDVEEFPSTVYRDAPDLREYRYIHRDTRTYVVEPRERRVIEEID
ncbi:DUF1236 domain-containing protein [Bradyrhizobium sp. PMVTL-01]|uniref:DUF1236 domain-containing protein n=1 Tax=unclassified Bradyrhizobium TaxID=2631580 RepID=UPI003F71A4B1